MIYSENILLCIGIPVLLTILYSRGSTRRFVTAILIGMAISLLSSYISGYLTLVSHMDLNDSAIYISPMVEETMKLLPLLFYLVLFRPDELGPSAWRASPGPWPSPSPSMRCIISWSPSRAPPRISDISCLWSPWRCSTGPG